MILLAFDVDGTLESSAGPVPIWVLTEHQQIAPTVIVGIVSPSRNWPWQFMPWLDKATPDSGREGNLRRFATEWPQAGIRLYVSDNGDSAAAHAAGFAYIEAADFAKGVA